MMNKIGFGNEFINNNTEIEVARERSIAPRKSVVRVYFPHRGMAWSYYNDTFDLREGDIVYVEGKLEGYLGKVVEVSYNFKIKISDYKKVISVADTDIKGEMFMAGSHFIAFDNTVLPYKKILTWYKAPEKSEEEFAFGNDDTTIVLDEIKSWNAPTHIIDRGQDYYIEDKVVYISIDGTKGRAIVKGTKAYEVEFEYKNGEISNLVCDCFCSGICKHQVATMFQLKDITTFIEKNYSEQFSVSNYFAAISKSEIFNYVISATSVGSLKIG